MRTLGKVLATGVVAALAMAVSVSPALAAAELTVTKDAGLTVAEGGDSIIFTVTVENTGDATADNVMVTDTLDARFVFEEETTVGGQATRTVLGDGSTQLRWSVGDLDAGEEVLLAYSVITPFLTADATINNNAVADADNTAEAEGDVDVDIEATPVSTPVVEIGSPPAGGGLPSTGISPLLLGLLLLPAAVGIERWAWARERAK